MATNKKAFQANARLQQARKHLRQTLTECAKKTDAAMRELRQAEIALRLAVDSNNWQ
jgi:hypothetical protein